MLADGEQLGDHWLLNKDGFFDQSYHIPLIVKAPTAAGLPGLAAEAAAAASALAGTVVEAFTEHVDILPSILEFVGLSVPPQADGRSLLPFLLAQPAPHWRDAAHWEFDCKCIRSLCVFSKKPQKEAVAQIAIATRQRARRLPLARSACYAAADGSTCASPTRPCPHCFST